MKSGPFIKAVAAAYRLDAQTVTLFARSLKEAGHMTSGARGVNAPHMMPGDLAALTIALLATEKPTKAVEMFEAVAGMQLVGEGHHGAVKSQLPDKDHTFLDLLTYLCDPKNKLDSKFPFQIEVTGAANATLKRPDLAVMYWNRSEAERLQSFWDNAPAEWDEGNADALAAEFDTSPMSAFGMVTTREISSTTLLNLRRFVFLDLPQEG
ncbi:hypothetical protein [Szabonella alba]|uniref:Uncharacterized protein n=1 Tax=Szabonella alba TaxID=2804194 RepID=A0A8K0Y140_9RHOB|nr:hypothetical protein [Szabonella alba]MBL4917763.1 hypothetical protein [Szabonella alba]